MSNGFVIFHRSFLEWEWYDDQNVKSLFIHLIIKANHKDKVWRGIEIKRGQLVTSSLVLAQELGLTRQQIRTALNKLKSTNEITTKATNKNTLVTVTNYDFYQSKGSSPTNKATNKATSEQPSNNHQITTTNNDNNENNINNNASGFSILLNRAGVRTSPSHPELINWQAQKVSLDEVRVAIDKAHEANPERLTINYLSAIIFNTRQKNKPKTKSEADKVWDRLFTDCICAPKLVSDVFGDKAPLVKKAIQNGTGKQITDIKNNTPEFNQKVVKKQFVSAYQELERVS